MTQEIVVRMRIEPDEWRLPKDEADDPSDPLELLILDAESQPLEEAGYGHGV